MELAKGLFGEKVKPFEKGRFKQDFAHAASPGTGPVCEKCGTCEHIVRFKQANAWHKCKLQERVWTGGKGTDVLCKDKACSFWEPQE